MFVVHMFIYFLSVVIRFALIFSPTHGFTSSTDYSHTVEVLAGDLLKVKHHTSWVFKPTFPTQSITVSYISFGLPVYLFSLFTSDSVYKIEYFQIVTKTWVFILSLVLDYFLHKTSQFLKCQSKSMILFSTFYITYSVAFKPSLILFENILFTSLLYLSIYFTILIQEKRSYSTLIPTMMGILISLGVFTDISFIYIGLWLFLWPCFWVVSRNTFFKVVQTLTFINHVLIAFLLTSFAITVIDSIYFQHLNISLSEKDCVNNFIPGFIVNYLYPILSTRVCVSGRFILIPYNAIQYYFDKSAFTHNMTPPTITNSVIGILTMFGPALLLFLYTACKIVNRTKDHIVAKFRGVNSPVTSRIYWIYKLFQFGMMLNVFFLITINFHKFSYAPFSFTPLSIPIFFVCGYSLEYYISNKVRRIFWAFWLAFNASLFLYYGVLHEAGVTKSLSAIQHSFIDKIIGREDCNTALLSCLQCTSSSHCQYHLFYSHTKQPPEHFLLWPHTYRSYNVVVTWESEGDLDIVKNKIGQIKERCNKSQCSILLVTLGVDGFEEKLHLGSPIKEIFPHFGQGTFCKQYEHIITQLSIQPPPDPTYLPRQFKILQGLFQYFVTGNGNLSDKINFIIKSARNAFSLKIYQI